MAIIKKKEELLENLRKSYSENFKDEVLALIDKYNDFEEELEFRDCYNGVNYPKEFYVKLTQVRFHLRAYINLIINKKDKVSEDSIKPFNKNLKYLIYLFNKYNPETESQKCIKRGEIPEVSPELSLESDLDMLSKEGKEKLISYLEKFNNLRNEHNNNINNYDTFVKHSLSLIRFKLSILIKTLKTRKVPIGKKVEEILLEEIRSRLDELMVSQINL